MVQCSSQQQFLCVDHFMFVAVSDGLCCMVTFWFAWNVCCWWMSSHMTVCRGKKPQTLAILWQPVLQKPAKFQSMAILSCIVHTSLSLSPPSPPLSLSLSLSLPPSLTHTHHTNTHTHTQMHCFSLMGQHKKCTFLAPVTSGKSNSLILMFAGEVTAVFPEFASHSHCILKSSRSCTLLRWSATGIVADCAHFQYSLSCLPKPGDLLSPVLVSLKSWKVLSSFLF